jgi:glycosyltransferase involved in cell wall biosynthesis
MAERLPVIASDIVPLKRVIEEEKCGVIFEANCERSFVDAVGKVYADKENRMGENGKAAVLKRYNWRNDSKVLLQAFEDLIRG